VVEVVGIGGIGNGSSLRSKPKRSGVIMWRDGLVLEEVAYLSRTGIILWWGYDQVGWPRR
jgi:hypothetical protein